MLKGQNISYKRGENSLFSNLSFSVKEGEALAVKGANGSGKTTFLRLLIGLSHPFVGTLSWKGNPLTAKNLSFYQRSLLYVGHKLWLHPEALIKDQVRLWHDFYGISLAKIEQALEMWGLSNRLTQKISHLSQGQTKRLSLSRCHWLERTLWILDEPQAGLDQTGKTILSLALAQQLEKGGSVILATHENVSASKEIFL